MKIRIKFTDQPSDFDPLDNCYIRALRKRYEIELSDRPELVLYGPFGEEFLRYPESVRVFLANEPVLPNFNDCDYAVGGAKLSFGSRYFRQPPLTGYGESTFAEKLKTDRNELPDTAADRKFCNFVYANADRGSGAALRTEFCRRLMAYKTVDCPGPVLNNMRSELLPRYDGRTAKGRGQVNRGWAESKLSFLQNYKFTIAFENTALPGFCSEKLIHPLLACSVPIYWGDPNVTDFFNPKAFINCADYGGDWDAVTERVIALDRDPEKYMEMLRQPPLLDSYPENWEEDLTEFFVSIVEGGLRPFDKNPIGFETMSAQSVGSLCREGKMGLHKIAGLTAQALSGWAHYKLHGRE